jgi:hypothetical protein
MSFERRCEAADGITARPIPRQPAPGGDRQRARRQVPADDRFPIALMVTFAGLGILLVAALVVGLAVWVYVEAAWEEPLVREPAFAPMEQKKLVDEAPPRDWFPPDKAQAPWIEPILPFQENPILPLREPFRAEGCLVCLDLKGKINWARDQAIDFGANHLGDMPMGNQTFAGIQFHIQDGAILLGGRPAPPSGRPLQVAGIGVKATFKRLYAFQTAHYSIHEKKEIGGYRLNYADGKSAVLPIIYGEDVSDWFFAMTPQVERARPGWSGRNGASAISFYVTRYDNPHPEKSVTAIDFFATNIGAAPVCVALTMGQ